MKRRGSSLALMAFVWSIALLLTALPVAGDDAIIDARTTPLIVSPTTGSVTIDGAIDEQEWSGALRLALDYENQPGENIPPPVPTEVMVTYDDRHLYVAFRCHDPDPDKIRARFTNRDQIWNDDFVGISLDTFNDERQAYELHSNPYGI